MEQCQVWNTPVYANIVDFEKFSISFTETLYGVFVIKLLYGDFRSKVICGQYLTEDFEIKTDVKQ